MIIMREAKIVIEWLEKLRDLYDRDTPREVMEPELIKMKERDWEIFGLAAREFQAWAAAKDDMDTFQWLLGFRGCIKFCRGGVRFEPGGYEEVKARIPDFLDTVFITEKEEFLDEIVKRIGISRTVRYGTDAYWHVGRKEYVYTDMPEAYVAVMLGNVRMADYFRRKNGYGSGVLERTCDILFQNDFRHGFDEILSIALFSKSKEMVSYVLRYYPNLPWNAELENEILLAQPEIEELLLETHPELIGFLDPAAVVYYGKRVFLQQILEKWKKDEPNLEKQEPELCEKRWLLEEGEEFGEVTDKMQEYAEFYEEAFQILQKKKNKRLLLQALFVNLMVQYNKPMEQLFLKYRYVEKDFTSYLKKTVYWNTSNELRGHQYKQGYSLICELYEKTGAERFPVRIDLENELKKGCLMLNEEMWKKVLEATIPVIKKKRSDWRQRKCPFTEKNREKKRPTNCEMPGCWKQE